MNIPGFNKHGRTAPPVNDVERQVRGRLSRRYDLCDGTWAHTTMLLTAEDRADKKRWA